MRAQAQANVNLVLLLSRALKASMSLSKSQRTFSVWFMRFPHVFRAASNSSFFILIGLRSLSEQDANDPMLSLIYKWKIKSGKLD